MFGHLKQHAEFTDHNSHQRDAQILERGVNNYDKNLFLESWRPTLNSAATSNKTTANWVVVQAERTLILQVMKAHRVPRKFRKEEQQTENVYNRSHWKQKSQSILCHFFFSCLLVKTERARRAREIGSCSFTPSSFYYDCLFLLRSSTIFSLIYYGSFRFACHF